MSTETPENRKIGAHFEGEIKEVDGIKYRWTDTGYTLRQYFSHSTEEKGPGPGWDFTMKLLNNKWSEERFGRTFSDSESIYPQDFPDIPYFDWEEVE